MELFYQENIESNQQNVVFSSEESRHIVQVLRKKNGDQVSVTNGKGFSGMEKYLFQVIGK